MEENRPRPISMFDRFENRAKNIRLTLAEALCFGALKHDLFDQAMEDVNDICLSENALIEFLKQKGLESEFKQFCNYGASE